MQFSPNCPNCFCGLPASPVYSEEFGLLYECHNLHNNPWVEDQLLNGRDSPESDQSDTNIVPSLSSSRQKDKICGYHIHKDTWDSFFDSESLDAEHPELAICPFFNFTFCAFFNLKNTYQLSHPPPPKCFCKLPATMRYVDSQDLNREELKFVCRNYLIDGARPKCTWMLSASEVPFQRPNGCTHPLQKQGSNKLLEPSQQIQSCNHSIVKRDDCNYDTRGRFGNNGYNNNGERFKSKKFNNHFQQEISFFGDKYSSNGEFNNHHSSERDDHHHHRGEYHRAERDDHHHHRGEYNNDHRPKNGNYQNNTYQDQKPILDNDRNSIVSRRVSNGTGSSYSQEGWDPGRNWKGRQYHKNTSWDNYKDLQTSSGSDHKGNSSGQVINKNTNSESKNREKSNIPNGRKSSNDVAPPISNVISMKVHMKETSYVAASNKKAASNCKCATDASRVLSENQRLKSEKQKLITKHEDEIDNWAMKVEDLEYEVKHLLSRVGNYKKEYESEQNLRQSCQRKIIELQAQIADVTKKIDELHIIKEKEKEEYAMGNMKCVLGQLPNVLFVENQRRRLLEFIWDNYNNNICGKGHELREIFRRSDINIKKFPTIKKNH
ncbi:13950_t:CDS:2 [Funneliformis geosporum]|uniref:1700_t:CDS:1 n=1 Tax=Funneliformis geosporum TaxID=1117311 RepID=A0A9W4SL79_9GLOM|nr:1700_t:CDS:2 [Funneliformis geosporum]CAI2186852.1 13950_t:CDS:2 [Funneliformis geosporum]